MDTGAAIALIAREGLLFAGIGFAIGGVDDLAVDLVYWLRRLLHGRAATPLERLPLATEGGRMAVFIPAWDEASVIAAMLRTALERYRHPDYQLYVGVYPNDPATIAAVRDVRDPRVRMVVGDRPGPTTKADCLNTLWRALIAEDARPRAVVLHDAEDVVHPDELTVFDALIGELDVVQLPVIPLIKPGSATSAVYADEFALSHGAHLPVRTALGAGMPLAGTGCAIATPMLARLAAERAEGPFDPASLVEDYELGLRIAALGGRGRLAHIADADSQPVAVRAYFPATLGAAVRQKTRWITGIALLGWDRTGWSRRFAPIDHWWRVRDRRTPLAMLVVAIGYAAMLAWLLAGRPALPPLTIALLRGNAVLLGWRLAMRAWFTGRLHGRREALLSVPRLLLGNLIAMLAAMRAMRTYLGWLAGTPLRWDKTAHEHPAALP
ncbi:hypothetical protein GCM10011380_11880 [Sphingomonas metalli]|uniref:Glycosyl transferase family protein n=1 Tax=Sphingomonas metalli TaxID=1779358 RepID=A0A916WRW6_9SPHN|nr:glycosyl transferase family protein [Sphingomonas metalli]GGB23842.1 hypothetical protein GCM10011380_11880 [Sphingomonas metalli]